MTSRDRFLLMAPLIGLAGLRLVPATDAGPTLCPIALATGVACPGCGMLRAVSHLIRGDVATALTYHPLVLLILGLAAVSWVWFLLRKLGKIGPFPAVAVNAGLATTAVLLVGVWVIRLTAETLPPV